FAERLPETLWRETTPAGRAAGDAAIPPEVLAALDAELEARAAEAAAIGDGRGAVDPAGRFEASATVSAQIYAPEFKDRHERAVSRAQREQGPVRVFTPAGAQVATLPPPPEAWAFGAGLLFVGDELLVECPDQQQVLCYALGAWDAPRRLAMPAVKWDAWCRGFVPAPGYVWLSEALFRRTDDGWRRVSRSPRPLALRADAGVIVWATLPLTVGVGSPGKWEERTALELPDWPTAATLAEDRLTVHGRRFTAVFERRAAGWRRLEHS
ncbi:MAG: hypothetical protein R3F43_33095, partial [bacterium]